MKSKLWLTFTFAVCSLTAADTKIKRNDLPAPVQQALPAITQGATVVGFGKETENGKTLYEIEMKSGKLTKAVTVDETGKILTVEQEVTLASLPPAVKASIVKTAGTAKIGRLESVTKGAEVTYEAVLTGGKTKELVIDQDGKVLSNK